MEIPFTLEFDLINLDNYCLLQVTRQRENNTLLYTGRTLTTEGHYKFIVTTDKVMITIDETVLMEVSSEGLRGYLEFVFDNTKGNSSITYKNLVVYSI